MNFPLKKIHYKDLNSRQKENYNFQKVAGELAEYGFNCLRLTDDWQGADFIACHIDGDVFLNGDDCYIYPHDEMVERVEKRGTINETKSWSEDGAYSWNRLSGWMKEILQDYKI